MRGMIFGLALFAALVVISGEVSGGQLWISHGGNYGSGGVPAGQFGVYEPPTTFHALYSFRGVSGLAHGPGKIYAYVGAGNGKRGTLVTVDAATGNPITSVVEPLNNFASDAGGHQPLGDLAYHLNSNTLYGAAAFGSSADGWEYAIYTIDPLTAARTLVGTAAATFDPHDGSGLSIALDEIGRLYAMDRNSNYIAELSRFDASFIAGTTLSMPTNAISSGMGLGYDAANNLLIGNFRSATLGDYSGLMTIDPANGFATNLLGDFADLRQIHDIAYSSEEAPIPTPATLPLLILSCGALGLRRRR